MLVPVVVAASTSPSPENVPPVILTVASRSFWSSGSVTVTLGDRVTVLLGAPTTDGATFDNVGASLTKVTLMVEVAVPVENDALPSLSVQVSVRVGFEPKLVGFSP